jgi:hypothetical protein
MAETIRQKIIDAIDTRLVAHPYSLPDELYWWRDLENNPIPADNIPAMEIRDNPDVITPHTFGTDLHALRATMTVIASTMAEIRIIIADLEKTIAQDRTWGSLAIDSYILSDEIEIEHYKEKYFEATIPMEVSFVTVSGDHYTKG